MRPRGLGGGEDTSFLLLFFPLASSPFPSYLVFSASLTTKPRLALNSLCKPVWPQACGIAAFLSHRYVSPSPACDCFLMALVMVPVNLSACTHPGHLLCGPAAGPPPCGSPASLNRTLGVSLQAEGRRPGVGWPCSLYRTRFFSG